jgi:hypothetical protein
VTIDDAGLSRSTPAFELPIMSAAHQGTTATKLYQAVAPTIEQLPPLLVRRENAYRRLIASMVFAYEAE